MVAILCPHCEEEIELEDDASGEFACPFCEGEFEWNMEPDTGSGRGGSTRGDTAQTGGGIPPTTPMEWVGHGLSIFILIFVIIFIFAFAICLQSADDLFWIFVAHFHAHFCQTFALNYRRSISTCSSGGDGVSGYGSSHLNGYKCFLH